MPDEPREQRREQPHKILIVEDSPMMTRMYRMALGSCAAELMFAGDGVEGLDRAATDPDVDLFLVDINMPNMNGLEFLRRAREELGLETPAIVISTEGSQSDRDASRFAGADGYLRKPWNPEGLFAAIREVYPAFGS